MLLICIYVWVYINWYAFISSWVGLFTTDNHVVLFIYRRINDRVTPTRMRTQLRLDFHVFSYSVSSTDG